VPSGVLVFRRAFGCRWADAIFLAHFFDEVERDQCFREADVDDALNDDFDNLLHRATGAAGPLDAETQMRFAVSE